MFSNNKSVVVNKLLLILFCWNLLVFAFSVVPGHHHSSSWPRQQQQQQHHHATTTTIHHLSSAAATSAPTNNNDEKKKLPLSEILDQTYKDERNVPNLKEWAVQRGVEFNAPGIQLVDNGLGDWGVGYFSTSNDESDEEDSTTSNITLEPQTTIMTIPSSLILSSNDKQVNHHEEYRDVITKSMSSFGKDGEMKQYIPECLLIVRLLQEVAASDRSIGSECQWKGWLQTLPQVDDFSTGIYLDDIESAVVKRLAYPFWNHQQQQWDACREAIQTLAPQLTKHDKILINLDDDNDNDDADDAVTTMIDETKLKWAFSVVFTRSWRPPPSSEKQPIATLVPLGDMFNHDSTNSNVFPNILEDGSIQIQTKTTIQSQDSLYLSYGMGIHPQRFLIMFGFWDRSAQYMDANLTAVATNLTSAGIVSPSQLVISTRNGAFTEDVFAVAIYRFLLERGDLEAANQMLLSLNNNNNNTTNTNSLTTLDDYMMKYDLEGSLWLRLHALKIISETYPEMDIAPATATAGASNSSSSPRRYGMIARYNNGMRDSWLRVIDYLEIDIEDAMMKRRQRQRDAKRTKEEQQEQGNE